MSSPPKYTKRQKNAAAEVLRRRKARRSLLAFTEATHPQWTSGRHHQLICEHLEAVERGEIKRLMISMPPRTSKTELVSRRYPAWLMGLHPEWQIVCTSHTAELVHDTSVDVIKIINDEEYRHIFPGTFLDPKAMAAARWRTTAGGIYVAAGVGGQITGRGANCAIVDDPVKGRNDAESPRMREIAWRWYLGDLVQRLMPGGSIVFCMTRWHQDDLAARALSADDWVHISLPAITNEYSPNEETLWPEFWSLDSMREKREMFSRGKRIREWNAQYQQNPVAEQGTYMQREWFSQRWEKLPDRLNVYIASDFAVTEPREGANPDYTEHGVFGVDHDDNLYVIDWWSGRTTPDVWIDSRLDLIDKHKPLAVFGEGGVIRQSVEPFWVKRSRERKVYSRCEWITSSKDKATRARAFQARSAMGKILFPANSPWAERVIEQCIAFPAGIHDDAFDVLSLMCLAIDQAHPATKVTKAATPKDRYKQQDRPQRNWRVA